MEVVVEGAGAQGDELGSEVFETAAGSSTQVVNPGGGFGISISPVTQPLQGHFVQISG